jgi:hypothetical protein
MSPIMITPQNWNAVKKRRPIIDTTLRKLYSSGSPNAGYEIQLGDELIVNRGYNTERQQPTSSMPQPPDPSTYGEITSKGARQLLYVMGLLDGHDDCSGFSGGGDIHLYDLGSGVGKFVIQAMLELSSKTTTKTKTKTTTTTTAPTTYYYGIELSPTRHDIAIQAKQRLLQLELEEVETMLLFRNYHDAGDNIQFVLDDILNVDLTNSTHIYVASLCFPSSLMTKLESKIVKECTGITIIATLQRFPNNLHQDPPIVSVQYIEMTWTKPFGCPVYLYQYLSSSPSSSSSLGRKYMKS